MICATENLSAINEMLLCGFVVGDDVFGCQQKFKKKDTKWKKICVKGLNSISGLQISYFANENGSGWSLITAHKLLAFSIPSRR